MEIYIPNTIINKFTKLAPKSKGLIEPGKYRWGSIVRSGDGNITVDVKDDFVIDAMDTMAGVINNFKPTVVMVKALGMQVKSNLRNSKKLVCHSLAKWKNEYEYSVLKVVSPEVVKYGYIIVERVKDNTEYTLIDAEIVLHDKYENLPEAAKTTACEVEANRALNILNTCKAGKKIITFATVQEAKEVMDKLIDAARQEEMKTNISDPVIEETDAMANVDSEYAVIRVDTSIYDNVNYGAIIVYRPTGSSEWHHMNHLINFNGHNRGSRANARRQQIAQEIIDKLNNERPNDITIYRNLPEAVEARDNIIKDGKNQTEESAE